MSTLTQKMTIGTVLLPPNHSPDDASIWRAAIGRGYSTFRDRGSRSGEREMLMEAITVAVAEEKPVIYYGNTLHREMLRPIVPQLKADRIDPFWVTRVDQDHAFLRKIQVVRYEALSGVVFPSQMFVKCCHEKWFSPGIMDSVPSGASMPDDMLHVQDPVDFRNELRCFVLNGEVKTSAWYKRDRKFWKGGSCKGCPKSAQEEELAKLMALVTPALPKAIVIDFGQLADGQWAVVEANEPWASGIYDCNPDACFEVIVAGQT